MPGLGARGQGRRCINYLPLDAFSFIFPPQSEDFRFCALCCCFVLFYFILHKLLVISVSPFSYLSTEERARVKGLREGFIQF